MHRHPFEEQVQQRMAQRDAESRRFYRIAAISIVALGAVVGGAMAGIPALGTNEGRGDTIEACADDPTVIITDAAQQPAIVSLLATAARQNVVTDTFAGGTPMRQDDFATLKGEILCSTPDGQIGLLPAGMKALDAITPSGNGLLEGLGYAKG